LHERARVRRTRLALSLLVLASYLTVAMCGLFGWLPDPQLRVAVPYQPPQMSLALLLGTDMFGRSVLYKLLSGTRTALTLGVMVPAFSVPLGVALGALAGYYGRGADAGVVWLIAVIAVLPDILIVTAISFVLGKGTSAILIAMVSVGWVSVCRLVRAECVTLRERRYVVAARALGAGDAHILARHIVPYVWHLAAVSGFLQAVAVIKFEVVLTYLGVGVQDGSSWGTMIADAASELVHGVWWPLAAVTAAMFALILALGALSDAVQPAPR
jgi:peptide/nickel transport system permease protein